VSDHRAIQPWAWKAQAMECRGEGLLLSAHRWDDLTTTAGLSALGAIAATGITSRGFHNNESPARHHSRRALRNSAHHHHNQEAMTHGQYARGAGVVKSSA
jgi:hypothetical protein